MRKKKKRNLEVVSSCRVTEAWWDSSHDGSTATGGYRFFRKHRLGIEGRQIMLYAREQLECMELCHEMVHQPVESL